MVMGTQTKTTALVQSLEQGMGMRIVRDEAAKFGRAREQDYQCSYKNTLVTWPHDLKSASQSYK